MERNEWKERAAQLRGKLTLEEKVGMIHGAQLFATKGVERLGIPPLVMSDGPMGVRQEFEADSWKAIGSSDDFVTYLPCNSALAATWNRDLAFAMGGVLGAEARGRGKDVILAPGINIKRSPLCGRNFEYFSEDPYLTGELAAPFIRGIQQWDVAACVKHFAVNNQETERLWVNVEVDERALREIYLPAFYDCLMKGGSLSVMGAYNRLYGEHCCQSGYLLGEILREEWKYDGVVISDWGGVHDTKLAASSQLDVEMSVTDNFDEYFMADPLKRAVLEGKIPESAVDGKVDRILMLMMRLHMLGDGERKSGVYNTQEHRQTALDVARESVVLLKNEEECLPLCAGKMRRVLVIGENGERVHSNGGGSAEIKALYEISPLMGIKMLLGGNVPVDYERGYESGKKEAESGVNWQEKSRQDGGGRSLADAQERLKGQERAQREKELRRRAVEKAAERGKYDAVIFIGGLNHDYDSEGLDREDMKLPYGQDELIRELLAVRPDMAVALVGGSPVEMEEWIEKAKAVVWSWYGGMEGGRALAEVLFGEVNPSGKLPETFYKTHRDCSAHCIGEFAGKEEVVYREGVFVGYRYNETFGVAPRYCFGHGLSYTEFSYDYAAYEEAEGRGYVVCGLTNIGERPGKETVQIYNLAENSEDELEEWKEKGNMEGLRLVKELAGFGKISLQPGESGELRIPLRNVPEEGCSIGIGSSVRDIRIELGQSFRFGNSGSNRPI